MIDQPILPTDELKKNRYYEVAQQEVDSAIPPAVSADPTIKILLSDVRTLMIMCWLCGMSWERERAPATTPSTDSALYPPPSRQVGLFRPRPLQRLQPQCVAPAGVEYCLSS